MSETKTADMVNHPPHYAEGKTLGIETIDIIQNELTPEEFRGYLKGQILKYQSRAGKKSNTVEDHKKAQWYLAKLIEVVEKQGTAR